MISLPVQLFMSHSPQDMSYIRYLNHSNSDQSLDIYFDNYLSGLLARLQPTRSVIPLGIHDLYMMQSTTVVLPVIQFRCELDFLKLDLAVNLASYRYIERMKFLFFYDSTDSKVRYERFKVELPT